MSDENPYRRPGESPNDWHERYRRAQASRDSSERMRLDAERRWDHDHANQELDQLLPTVEEEARFLAKVYVWAKHLGRDKELIDLLGKVIKLQPNKVLNAAGVFGRLARIYDDVGIRGGEAYTHVKNYWKGETAESFGRFFIGDERVPGLIGKINASTYSLSVLASGTSRLLNEFGKSLIAWRNDIAKAIKTLAAKERERDAALASDALDVITLDWAAMGAQLVDVFIKTLRSVEQQRDDKDLIWFDEFVKSQDIDRSLPDEEEYMKKNPAPLNMPPPRLV